MEFSEPISWRVRTAWILHFFSIYSFFIHRVCRVGNSGVIEKRMENGNMYRLNYYWTILKSGVRRRGFIWKNKWKRAESFAGSRFFHRQFASNKKCAHI